MATVRLRNLRKSFGPHEVVHGIDIDIADREFVVLVGASGCGKSTTLRMIAGLEDVTEGEIWIGDSLVNEIEPRSRDIAMVFQDYALYPHMSVFENMAFGLEYRDVPKPEIARRVREAASILNIGDLLERRPKQLSGGQRQRVAMGRAIVRHPKVFLFDEPLSNLDAKLRVQMRTEIKKLHQRVATTVVYVTHDQVEAMTLADRIVLMRDGNIEHVGVPDEIYNAPASAYVAGFIGSPTMNLMPARLTMNGEGLAVELGPGITLPVPDERRTRYEPHVERSVTFGLRPEDFLIQPDGEARQRLDVQAGIVEPLGSDTLVTFPLAGAELIARVPPGTVSASGAALALHPRMSRMHLFDAASGQLI